MIPDAGGGGELKDARPVAEPGRRVRKGERLSDEHRRKVSEGVKRAAAERKARERGEPSADKPPKPKRERAAAPDRRAGELQLIREWAGAVLSAPAMVGGIAGDPWLTDHFTTRGPALADALVKEAERNEKLRAMLINIATAAGPAALLMQAGLYIALPLMHFGALPGGELLGVPVINRGPMEPPRPEPGRTPPFVAPEHGPAVAPMPDPPPPAHWVDVDEVAAAADVPADELAAELAAHENGGGMMPPLPIEPA